MKIIAKQPGQILRCVCKKHADRQDCDVHRERAFIEFRITPPRWWLRFWFGVLKQ